MELLTSPKTTYLLEAGIEVLHEQSNEWLSEIAFWRDEAAFLYSLVVIKTLKSVPVSAKANIETIEKELVSITGGELDKLQKTVESHELFLAELLENYNHKDEGYRQQHQQINTAIVQFEKRFKLLKKEVFKLAEQAAKDKN
jgi:hypothetical protein